MQERAHTAPKCSGDAKQNRHTSLSLGTPSPSGKAATEGPPARPGAPCGPSRGGNQAGGCSARPGFPWFCVLTHTHPLPGDGDALGVDVLRGDRLLQLVQLPRLLQLLHQALHRLLAPFLLLPVLLPFLPAQEPLDDGRSERQDGGHAGSPGRAGSAPPLAPRSPRRRSRLRAALLRAGPAAPRAAQSPAPGGVSLAWPAAAPLRSVCPPRRCLSASGPRHQTLPGVRRLSAAAAAAAAAPSSPSCPALRARRGAHSSSFPVCLSCKLPAGRPGPASTPSFPPEHDHSRRRGRAGRRPARRELRSPPPPARRSRRQPPHCRQGPPRAGRGSPSLPPPRSSPRSGGRRPRPSRRQPPQSAGREAPLGAKASEPRPLGPSRSAETRRGGGSGLRPPPRCRGRGLAGRGEVGGGQRGSRSPQASGGAVPRGKPVEGQAAKQTQATRCPPVRGRGRVGGM